MRVKETSLSIDKNLPLKEFIRFIDKYSENNVIVRFKFNDPDKFIGIKSKSFYKIGLQVISNDKIELYDQNQIKQG